MPKTKFQNVVFTLMMSFLMVYAMICYNISMNIGGMTNQVFLMAFHEMMIMWPAAFILEFFLVDHLAHKLAFCMVTPQDRPIVITLAISIMIIAIMCPIMSFIATLLFKNAGKEFVAVWLQTTFLNFPVAFFWQLMYCGPFIRFLFRKQFDIGYYFLHLMIPELVYTLLVTILLYWLILKINQWLEKSEKRSEAKFV